MSHTHDHEGEPRYYGLYFGVVVDNADQQMLGRVRINVPGLMEPAGPWSFPVGGSHASGSKQRGSYDVPEKGATVAVMFQDGDPDVPVYFGAWHGLQEALSAVPSSPENAPKIKVYESERFLIVLNGQGGSEELIVRDKVTGDGFSIKESQLKITATTKVTVSAPQIEIGADDLGNLPLVNGVVLASGVDSFTGATYGALGSASAVVTAKKA